VSGGYITTIEKACPSCPIDENTVTDHCDSSCYCACHAPLPGQTLRTAYSQLITFLVFAEPFKAVPEVFLPKFIPPQIQA
jgi:hypothetical protein